MIDPSFQGALLHGLTLSLPRRGFQEEGGVFLKQGRRERKGSSLLLTRIPTFPSWFLSLIRASASRGLRASVLSMRESPRDTMWSASFSPTAFARKKCVMFLLPMTRYSSSTDPR